MKEGPPLVHHIVRYRSVALTFREGKQPVELFLRGGEGARGSQRSATDSPSCPVLHNIKLKYGNLSYSCHSRVPGILLTSLVFPKFYLRLTDTENRKRTGKRKQFPTLRAFLIGLREGNPPVPVNTGLMHPRLLLSTISKPQDAHPLHMI